MRPPMGVYLTESHSRNFQQLPSGLLSYAAGPDGLAAVRTAALGPPWPMPRPPR